MTEKVSVNNDLGQLISFLSVVVDLPFNLVIPNFSTAPKKRKKTPTYPSP